MSAHGSPQVPLLIHSQITGLRPFLRTGRVSYNAAMTYAVTLRDRTVETVEGADAFAHEKLMTTFYRTSNSRRAIDCWATPLASFRTDEILMVRTCEAPAAQAGDHEGAEPDLRLVSAGN